MLTTSRTYPNGRIMSGAYDIDVERCKLTLIEGTEQDDGFLVECLHDNGYTEKLWIEWADYDLHGHVYVHGLIDVV